MFLPGFSPEQHRQQENIPSYINHVLSNVENNVCNIDYFVARDMVKEGSVGLLATLVQTEISQ